MKQSYKKLEFVEKSKFIFGEKAFSYNLVDDNITSQSHITLICNTCKRENYMSIQQHISMLYGCKYCGDYYHKKLDNKDEEVERNKRKTEIKFELMKIKDKYRKIYDVKLITVEDAAKIIESNNLLIIDPHSKSDIEKVISYLESNGGKITHQNGEIVISLREAIYVK